MADIPQRPDDGPILTEAAQRALHAWRAAHPQATFADLEGVVEERVRQVRVQMLATLLAAPTPCALEEAAARCPVCGAAMQARGRRTRRMTVEGDHSLPLPRTYAVCPGCGTGLFPP